MRALLRAIYVAVILGVGIDAFFFAWLYAEDRAGLDRTDARAIALGVAVVATLAAWGITALIRQAWRRRSHSVTASTRAVVAQSPLADPAAIRRGVEERAARVKATEERAARVRAADAQRAMATDSTWEFEPVAAPAAVARPEPEPVPAQAAPEKPAPAPRAPAQPAPEKPAPRQAEPRPAPRIPEADAAAAHFAELNESVVAGQANLDAAAAGYGPDDPRTLRAKAVLACAYWAIGELDRCIPLYEQTIDAAVRVLGEDHLDTLAWSADLAAAYELGGRLDDAIEMYRTTLARRERTIGQHHPDTELVRSNLAVATTVRSNLSRGR